MAEFEKFNFKTIDEVRSKVSQLDVNLTLSDNLEILKTPVKVGHKTSPNSIAILPMEGCDALPEGGPSELLTRRYHRFAEGGAGLLWWEACAVTNEGRANPLQMFLTRANVADYAQLVAECNRLAEEKNGAVPVNIVQLTHSGRYSRPVDKAAPLVPQHDPILDPRVGIEPNDDSPIVTDEYLDALQDKYVQSAVLAKEAGFDGVDIKACHRYLVSELLASHTREGKYGVSYENRSRFLLEVVRKIRAALGDNFIVASRFNVYDAHPYPYGFGCDKDDFWKWDKTDPMQLVEDLVAAGVNLLSNSGGNPYYIYPQVTRPFDTPAIGGNTPEEHPLESMARLFEFTREIKKHAGNVPVIGNGYSWLRQFFPHAGAANIADGSVSMVGIGREAFAYPDCVRDILTTGQMDPSKCCTACSRCTQIMRDHGRTGCVIRDAKVYVPLFQEARKHAEEASK